MGNALCDINDGMDNWNDLCATQACRKCTRFNSIGFYIDNIEKSNKKLNNYIEK